MLHENESRRPACSSFFIQHSAFSIQYSAFSISLYPRQDLNLDFKLRRLAWFPFHHGDALQRKAPKSVAGLRGGVSLKRRVARHPDLQFPLPPCAAAFACPPSCVAAS